MTAEVSVSMLVLSNEAAFPYGQICRGMMYIKNAAWRCFKGW